MTIVAGFKASEGIVLCADTQETIQQHKRNVTKLRVAPAGISKSNTNLGAAFCGAGEGPFIDKLIDLAWSAIQKATKIDEACELAENSIKEAYRIFGSIYQTGYCPNAELIFAIKMGGESRLFTASGPIVNEKEEYDSAGTGVYMADFLASRMYSSHLTLYQCVILAAYVLFQTKEHVEGCGGESEIAILRNDGLSGYVDRRRIEAITKQLEVSDSQLSRLLIDLSNLETSKTQLKGKMKGRMQIIEEMRVHYMKEVKEGDDLDGIFGITGKRDELGFVVGGRAKKRLRSQPFKG